jgi:hypothetical protein
MRAEHCFVDGLELVAFDPPPANGFDTELQWEVFDRGTMAQPATGTPRPFDAPRRPPNPRSAHRVEWPTESAGTRANFSWG